MEVVPTHTKAPWSAAKSHCSTRQLPPSAGQRSRLPELGTPERTREKGDPYANQCHTTAHLLAQALGLERQQYLLTFQSRFGLAKWLQPCTTATLQQLARKGIDSVDVICPGFVCDCLETLEEISQQAQQAFIAAGGKTFHYIPCLNDNPDWIAALGHISQQHLAGWNTTQAAPRQP